jgi:hypothetical protein
MPRFDGLLLIALSDLRSVLHYLLGFDGVLIKVHGCCCSNQFDNRLNTRQRKACRGVFFGKYGRK